MATVVTGDAESATLPPLDIKVKDVANGSLATVRAERRQDVSLLRDQAHGLETFWATSSCTKHDKAASR
jgi:hypothetical protein